MALESLTNKIIQNCNGALTDFDFSFPITASSDLQVIMTLISTGVEQVLTLTTDYTVTASANDYDNGGTVSTVATWSALYTITIYRNVPLTQPSTFTENMQTLYQTFEDGLNRLTMIDQAQEERIDSCLKIKKSDSDATLELPIKDDRASRYLAFDADGEPIASSGSPDSVVPVSAYMETILDDVNEATFKATVNLEIGTDVQAYSADLDILDGLAASKFPARSSAGATAEKSITDDALTLLDNAVAQGDIAYGSAANVWSQLAKGATGQIVRYTATIPSVADAIVSGTVVASTSGVAIDFTSIPAWVKRITVNLNGVSTNGTSSDQIQLGDGGGVETSGYDMACQVSSGGYPGSNGGAGFTSGFVVAGSGIAVAAANLYSGQWVFTLLDAATFLWVGSGQIAENGGARLWVGVGKKALSAALDRIRITTVNGTDTFDAGAINILYE